MSYADPNALKVHCKRIKFMLLLLYITIAAAFIADYRDLAEALGPLGRFLPLMPELFSFVLLVTVLLHVAIKKEHLALSPKYLIIGFLIVLHIVFGLIVNQVSAGVIVAGIRDYFRFLPLFLVPIALDLDAKELQRLLKFILAMCFLQAPVAIYQRIVHFRFRGIEGGAIPSDLALAEYVGTGDWVRGTLGTGSLTSTLLVCCIVVLGAFYIRRRLSPMLLILSVAVLAIPTFINETKATVILFAIAMLGLSVLASKGFRAIWSIFASISLTALFIVIFASAYDHFFPEKHGETGLLEYYTQSAVQQQYKGMQDPSERRGVPRIDSIVFAYRNVSTDASTFFFGKGIGNVGSPARHELMRGEFSEFYHYYNVAKTTYTDLIWHIGFGGILLLLVLTLLVFQDARRISKLDSTEGAFALGWSAIMLVLPIALLYKSLVHASALLVLLMYFSGYIAATRIRLSRGQVARPLVGEVSTTANRDDAEVDVIAAGLYGIKSSIGQRPL